MDFTFNAGPAAGAAPPPSGDATLWVDASTGDDTRSKATVAASGGTLPWASIHRAVYGATFGGGTNTAEAAAAGDVVSIAPGTYEAVASATVFYVALNPVNSGSSGNPIRFQATDNAKDVIRIVPRSGSGTGGSPIGAAGVNYIEWSGFDLNETDWPWNGPNDYENGKVLFDADATGCVLERSKLTGTVTATRDGDNYTLVRLHEAHSTTIRDCLIQDVGISDENTSGSTWYHSDDTIFENCHFINCGAGIYVKGYTPPVPDQSIRVRYCIFDNCYYAIDVFTAGKGSATVPIIFHNNIAIGGEYGVQLLTGFSDDRAPINIKILSNVFYNQVQKSLELRGELIDTAGIEHKNNIIFNSSKGVDSDGGGLTTTSVSEQDRFASNRNCVSTSGTFTSIGSNMSFATWQSTYSQDANSVGDNPDFTNAAADDFTLQIGSPAIDLGRAIWGIGGADDTVIDAGAYSLGSETIGRL